MSPPEDLATQAQRMEAAGAHCVYITDSGGRLTMNDVRDRMRAYRAALRPETQIGIHAHHNLTFGVANSVVAVEEGCYRVDASLAARLPEATWAFGSHQGAWRTVRLEAGDRPSGPAVAATATVVLDVTSGRATDVAGLWRRRELVTHDPAGMLALLPVLEHVPGLPGTATLGMLARYAGGLGRLLGRWPRLGR